MTDRDIRVIENMARTGMSLDDLCEAFDSFSSEEIEKIYAQVHREMAGEDQTGGEVQTGIKLNCS
ncbi:MAG: hypothetical protein K5886_01020 [Lachnospiraceae bacterium]|nr:hypothetical protein [Lachnospiraceae bacterium]